MLLLLNLHSSSWLTLRLQRQHGNAASHREMLQIRSSMAIHSPSVAHVNDLGGREGHGPAQQSGAEPLLRLADGLAMTRVGDLQHRVGVRVRHVHARRIEVLPQVVLALMSLRSDALHGA